MRNVKSLNRRHFPGTSAAALGAASLGLPRIVVAQDVLTVGFIYVGPKDDFGYNQAHAEGAAAVKAMELMINFDGAALPFPTSFGYFNPHIIELAPK